MLRVVATRLSCKGVVIPNRIMYSEPEMHTHYGLFNIQMGAFPIAFNYGRILYMRRFNEMN